MDLVKNVWKGRSKRTYVRLIDVAGVADLYSSDICVEGCIACGVRSCKGGDGDRKNDLRRFQAANDI